MAEPSFDDRFNNELPDYVSLTPVEGNPFTAKVAKATNRLLGLNGEERYQTWPERMVRSGLTAPYDALTGRLQVNDPETNMPTGEAIGRSMDVAGLAGGGSIGASERGAVLGSGPMRKFKNEIRNVESDPNYVYHATNVDRANDIAESGKLNIHKPHEFTDQDVWPDGRTEKRNYFTPNANNTWQFAPEEGQPVLLRVKKDSHPFKRESTGDIYSTKPVEAKNIEYLDSDNKWKLLSDTQKPGMVMSSIMNANEKAPPFFSALEHAVENTKQAKMPADQWLGTISNSKGVKPEELDWTGFKDFLAEKGKQPVTKQELQEHLNNNKVELKEVNKGSEAEFRKIKQNYIDQGISENEASNLAEKDIQNRQQTKYSQYQLPGGENYREMLLTLPNKPKPSSEFAKDYYENFVRKGGQPSWEELPIERQNQLIENSPKGLNTGDQYRSSHWDEPNILAHVRMNDRAIEAPGDLGPKKSLHLEEIQSDWHQQGREKGYKSQDRRNISFEDFWKDTRMGDLSEASPRAIEMARRDYESGGRVEDNRVPDAPFKKSWHELALKRMIREAAEKGYDRLSWTPGEAQAARYDLSKQVDKINLVPDSSGKFRIDAFKNNNKVVEHYAKDESEIASVIGKEAAKKLLESRNQHGAATLVGQDLKIGGEGMKGFYDQIIPKAIEKIGKEHGVKVKTAEVDASKRDAMGRLVGSKIKQPVHYIDIPESLKNAAIGKGFPLFSSGLPLSFHPVDGNPFEDKK